MWSRQHIALPKTYAKGENFLRLSFKGTASIQSLQCSHCMFFIHIQRKPFYIPNGNIFALYGVVILLPDVGRGRELLQQWWAPWGSELFAHASCSCLLVLLMLHPKCWTSTLWWLLPFCDGWSIFQLNLNSFFSPVKQCCTIEIKYQPYRHFQIFLFITFEKVKQRTQMELATMYCLYYKKSTILA